MQLRFDLCFFALLFARNANGFHYSIGSAVVRSSPLSIEPHCIIQQRQQCASMLSKPQNQHGSLPLRSSANNRANYSDRRGEVAKFADPLEKITFNDVFSPRGPDRAVIGRLLAGEAFILAVGTVFCFCSALNPFLSPSPCSFDVDSMRFALAVALPFSALAALVDKLPIDFFKETARDTRVFATRVIGRKSNVPTAVAVALLMSGAAAFAEEVLFRGFLYNFADKNFGIGFAVAASSLLFGLGHTFTFGPNALLESVYGSVFAVAYIASGYNLAVPIAVHTIYDFSTLLLCWLLGTRELRLKLAEAKQRLNVATAQSLAQPQRQTQQQQLPAQFDAYARVTFSALDVNKDGAVSEDEFITGTRLYGLGLLPFSGGVNVAREAFLRTDANGDGRVDFNEFSAALRQTLSQWLLQRSAEATATPYSKQSR